MSLSEAVVAEATIVKEILSNHALNLSNHILNLFGGKSHLPCNLQGNVSSPAVSSSIISSSTVMLLSGYIVGPPSLRGLVNYLVGKGFNASCENYSFWKSLSKVELELGERLDRICQKIGGRVKIIGHSEGGLIGCGIAQKFPENVSQVISLGAPFKGTYAAYLNYFVPGVRDMAPGSAYLQEMHERGFPGSVQFFSLHSPYDEAVIPASSSILPERKNVTNICIDIVAHGGLIGKRCYSLIEKILSGEFINRL